MLDYVIYYVVKMVTLCYITKVPLPQLRQVQCELKPGLECKGRFQENVEEIHNKSCKCAVGRVVCRTM